MVWTVGCQSNNFSIFSHVFYLGYPRCFYPHSECPGRQRGLKVVARCFPKLVGGQRCCHVCESSFSLISKVLWSENTIVHNEKNIIVNILLFSRQKNETYSHSSEFCFWMQEGTVKRWYKRKRALSGSSPFSPLLIQSPHGKNISNLATQKKEARTYTWLFETYGDAAWPQTSWSTQG